MAEIKRLNYFTSQFLVEKDFKDEQGYHVGMRRRHNRTRHSWGVAEGMIVAKTGDKTVSISPGTAIDKEGQEIVVSDTIPYTLTTLTSSGTDIDVYLTIKYSEVFDSADHYTSAGVDNYTRSTERPLLADTIDTPPANGSVIVLAKIHLKGDNISKIDDSVRKEAGSIIAPGEVDTDALADGAVTSAKLAGLSVGTSAIQDNAVTAAKILDSSVGSVELANGAVTEPKLADNAVTAAKIADGSVGTSELANGSVIETRLADNSVSIKKLKTQLVWDGSSTIAANGTAGFNALAVPLTDPRGACLLINAYSTTNGARFVWTEQSTTGGTPPYWINQNVFFQNLSSIAIEVKFKIYEILES
jgi:hypothetical protein